MNESQEKRIEAAFTKLRDDAAEAYKNVYDNIRNQLKNSSSHGLSGEIAQLEAKELNREILLLTDTVKQAAIDEMIASGCKPYLTQAGWTEIQQVTGLPHTELCKVQVDIVQPTAKTGASSSSSSSAATERSKFEEQAQMYSDSGKLMECLTAVGAAAIVISLFIPGWSLPVKVLCAAGAITVIGGVSGTIANRKEETESKFKDVGKQAPPRTQSADQLDDLVRKITESQCERNLGLYNDWLAKVRDALVAECDKLSAM